MYRDSNLSAYFFLAGLEYKSAVYCACCSAYIDHKLVLTGLVKQTIDPKSLLSKYVYCVGMILY